MFGHWASEYGPDGSLPFTVKSTKDSIAKEATRSNNCAKKVLRFNMARRTNDSNVSNQRSRATKDITHGSLVDDGAPYAAIGKYELPD